jgi:hypothetical protein
VIDVSHHVTGPLHPTFDSAGRNGEYSSIVQAHTDDKVSLHIIHWEAKVSSATRELINLEPSTIQLRWIRKHNPLEKSDEFSNLGANLWQGKHHCDEKCIT